MRQRSPLGQEGKKATQFKPGQSGNPAGKPKGATLTHQLKMRANREGKQLVDVLWETAIGRPAVWDTNSRGTKVLVTKAVPPDMRAMAMIWNRVEGKVPDRVEISEGLTRDELLAGLKARIGAYEAASDPDGVAEGPGAR